MSVGTDMGMDMGTGTGTGASESEGGGMEEGGGGEERSPRRGCCAWLSLAAGCVGLLGAVGSGCGGGLMRVWGAVEVGLWRR